MKHASEMSIGDIEMTCIIVQFKNGKAHQVLASKENKEIILRLLAHSENGLKLTKELVPITFEYRS